MDGRLAFGEPQAPGDRRSGFASPDGIEEIVGGGDEEPDPEQEDGQGAAAGHRPPRAPSQYLQHQIGRDQHDSVVMGAHGHAGQQRGHRQRAQARHLAGPQEGPDRERHPEAARHVALDRARGLDRRRQHRGDQGARDPRPGVGEDLAADPVDHPDRGDAAGRDQQPADEQERRGGEEEARAEFGGRVKPPGAPAEQVVEPVAEGQQVHEEGRLVEPVGIEVPRAHGHGAPHEVELVAVVGEGEVVAHRPETQRRGEQQHGDQGKARSHGGGYAL